MAGQREHQRNFRPHHTRADDADFFERPHFKPLHHDKPRRSRVDIFYRIAFRKKVCGSIAEIQGDLKRWIQSYDE